MTLHADADDLAGAAIHADKVASQCGDGQEACAREHRQLANWLRELRTARVKLDLADEILRDMGDYQCDRAEENGGDVCPEILDEDDEPLYEPDDWCPFCRARDWVGCSCGTDD